MTSDYTPPKDDQIRHWLAMHCDPREARAIADEIDNSFNRWVGDVHQTFELVNGFKSTPELGRYVWADRMLAASRLRIIGIENH